VKTFTYLRPPNPQAAVEAATTHRARYVAGGTNLLDLMREGVEQPTGLVDVSELSTGIRRDIDGTLVLGAGATNTAVAEHSDVRTWFPLISRSILNGASGQIRNMATVGGNLLQRTRCLYFYDATTRCNKRVEGSGCDAVEGDHHNHAILGASPSCAATHSSDLCVALAALDASVHVLGPDGERTIDLLEFHELPGDRPSVENVLGPHELITSVSVPPLSYGHRSTYRKVRERTSYAFALVSVAAALDIEDGVVRDARLALGGVAPKPWRATGAEALLRGARATGDEFRRAAEAVVEDASPLRDNAYKIPLATRTVVATLEHLAGAEARS